MYLLDICTSYKNGIIYVAQDSNFSEELSIQTIYDTTAIISQLGTSINLYFVKVVIDSFGDVEIYQTNIYVPYDSENI